MLVVAGTNGDRNSFCRTADGDARHNEDIVVLTANLIEGMKNGKLNS